MRLRSLYALIGLLLFVAFGAGALTVLLLPRGRVSARPSAFSLPAPPTRAAAMPLVSRSSPTVIHSARSNATDGPVIANGPSGQLPPTPVAPVTQGTLEVSPEVSSPVDTTTDVPMPPTAIDVPITDVPVPPATPEHIGGPVPVPNKHPGPRWVTLQAGHWRSENLPDELQHLSRNTGASAAGIGEVDINVAATRLTARRLQERGYSVEILDATVPMSYTTDLFLALHADGNALSSWRGFKAVAPWNSVPASDALVGFLYEEYGKATGLPTDARTTDAMAGYYAFSPERYRHALAPGVPAALLEMGFVTNPDDRKVLSTGQEALAWGIANAVDRYFRSGQAGTPPTPYPTFTPTRTPTRTPTGTATSTPTYTATSTGTATPVPTEFAAQATGTAVLVTPPRPTSTPTLPRLTPTPSPTATPLTGTVTLDGRWLPPLSQNGRNLPSPGSDAAPVLLSDSTQPLPLLPDGRQMAQVWQQFYVPELGRSIWRKGPVSYVRR